MVTEIVGIKVILLNFGTEQIEYSGRSSRYVDLNIRGWQRQQNATCIYPYKPHTLLQHLSRPMTTSVHGVMAGWWVEIKGLLNRVNIKQSQKAKRIVSPYLILNQVSQDAKCYFWVRNSIRSYKYQHYSKNKYLNITRIYKNT